MHMGDSSSGGGQSPLTARSLRLERVAQALAHSQEELRRLVVQSQVYSILIQVHTFCSCSKIKISVTFALRKMDPN